MGVPRGAVRGDYRGRRPLPHASIDRRSEGLGSVFEEFADFDAEGLGDAFDGVEGGALFAPFDDPDVGAMQAALGGQLILRPTPLGAQCADSPGKQLAD